MATNRMDGFGTYPNPILPGFYPDPSICRAGEFYYLVSSTFAYFPGVPVFRSRDLKSWEQIGNVLERTSQLKLEGCGHSDGIYAPTIRYHDGVFYMITTNVSDRGNFLVTAKKPEGPWSDPHYLGDEAAGIDPSLFFDEDGTCWYIGQRNNSLGSQYFGDCEIWIRRLNLSSFRLEGEEYILLHGFSRHAIWPEGPHLYRKDGYYYILHAEGGTDIEHAVMIARSREVTGPYEYCKYNPILTHRHLGVAAAVNCVGHGDLVEDGQGNWYMVVLGCRPCREPSGSRDIVTDRGYTLKGRETFLAQISWADGWPLVNPGLGLLRVPQKDVPIEKTYRFAEEAVDLSKDFLTLRKPFHEIIGQSTKDLQFPVDQDTKGLPLPMHRDTLEELASPSYVCIRQRNDVFTVTAKAKLSLREAGDCAGIAMVQNDQNQIRLEAFCQDGRRMVRAINRCRGKTDVVHETTLSDGGTKPVSEHVFVLEFKLEVSGLYADLACRYPGEAWNLIAEKIPLKHLSTESSGGFVGCTAGMYASGNGTESAGYAEFLYFSYQGEMARTFHVSKEIPISLVESH